MSGYETSEPPQQDKTPPPFGPSEIVAVEFFLTLSISPSRDDEAESFEEKCRDFVEKFTNFSPIVSHQLEEGK